MGLPQAIAASKAEGWKRKGSAAEIWFLQMDLFRRNSTYPSLWCLFHGWQLSPLPVPGTVPSYWSLWKEITLDSEARIQDKILFLSPLRLHTASNVALSSLWGLRGFSSQETVKYLQENRKVDLTYSCPIKKSQKDFTSAAAEWQQGSNCGLLLFLKLTQ